MKTYSVEFAEQAIDDLEASFEWGCENWGTQRAASWYFDIRDTINDQLRDFPLACPLAPHQSRFEDETRVLVVGRYNVLFHVCDRTVTVLHIRGPFN